jgi:RNA polymerase sigma-70 factor (ECF subfamily)
MRLDEALVSELFRTSGADGWRLTAATFAQALEASAAKTFAGSVPSAAEVARYLRALHLQDLALACACAGGDDSAWEFFVRELRPVLYRSADAIDASGGARELADSIYADLFGLDDRSGVRRSLFRYFHGRSSLATWLRAVLVQRHVDRVRAGRRVEALPDEELAAPRVSPPLPDTDRETYVLLMRRALTRALGALAAGDRLRLGCYYAQGMSLASIGRMLREHESTVSRHLARTRRAIREDVERQLQHRGFTADQIAECFASVTADAGPLDLNRMLELADARKESTPDRSTRKAPL